MTQGRQSFQSEDLGVSDTANVNECHQPGPRERLCGLGAWERLAPHTVPADASRGPSQISLCRQRLRWSSSPTHGRQDPQGHPCSHLCVSGDFFRADAAQPTSRLAHSAPPDPEVGG